MTRISFGFGGGNLDSRLAHYGETDPTKQESVSGVPKSGLSPRDSNEDRRIAEIALNYLEGGRRS